MDDSETSEPAPPQDDGTFEALLWELFLRFVDVPAERVDLEIRHAQRRICEVLGLDRSALWQPRALDPAALVLTHMYDRYQEERPVDELTGSLSVGATSVFPVLTGAAYPAQEDPAPHFPWLLRRLAAGLTSVVPSIDDLPLEAAADRDSLRRFGTRATVVVPLRAEATILGGLSFASTRGHRPWPDDDVRRVELVAQVFARALTAKRASLLERANAARLQAAFDVAQLGFYLMSDQGSSIELDDRARDLLGVPAGQDTGIRTFWLEHVHPEDADRVLDASQRAISGHADRVSIDYRYHHPSRGVTWLAHSVRALRYTRDGLAASMAGVFQDITDRKHVEEALRASDEINRVTFQQAAIGIAHVATDGRWLSVNDKLCDILGYTREELVGGMTFQQVTLPDDLGPDLELMRATLAGRQPAFTLEKRYLRRNGSTIWVNVTVSLVRDRSGRQDFFIGIIENITGRKQVEEELARTHAQVQRLSEQLARENTYLRQEVTVRKGGGRIVGQSPAIRASLAEAEQVAATDSTVLLLGETGTGKELFAEAIHQWSARRDRTMVRVNCAAIPTTLLESELFGREKGAFTGALARQIGRFELAHGSTIFLDEIGDLPPEVQVKLLRVIEGRRLERLGSPNPVTVDVRIIAATHRDLRAAVRLGQFREDLYYRLNVFPIVLPRLRDRIEDLPLLAGAILDDLGKSMGKRFDPLPRTALQALQRYHWPGNIRELRNVIERAMITSTPPTLNVSLPVPVSDEGDPASGGTLQAVEKARILEVLARTGWRIRGAKGAAAILGLPPTTLENRMKRLKISRPTAPHDQW